MSGNRPDGLPRLKRQSDIVEIVIPRGYKVDELPPPLSVDTGAATYRSKGEVTGATLRYVRNYQIKEGIVPTEGLADLKKFYRQVSADERSSAVLKRSLQ